MPDNFEHISDVAARVALEALRKRREVFEGSSIFTNCEALVNEALFCAESADMETAMLHVDAIRDIIKTYCEIHEALE